MGKYIPWALVTLGLAVALTFSLIPVFSHARWEPDVERTPVRVTEQAPVVTTYCDKLWRAYESASSEQIERRTYELLRRQCF